MMRWLVAVGGCLLSAGVYVAVFSPVVGVAQASKDIAGESLKVDGNGLISGTLDVGGDVTIKGDLKIGGKLIVGGKEIKATPTIQVLTKTFTFLGKQEDKKPPQVTIDFDWHGKNDVNGPTIDLPKSKKIVAAFPVIRDHAQDIKAGGLYRRWWQTADVGNVGWSGYLDVTTKNDNTVLLQLTPQEKGVWVIDIVVIYETD